jgi:hypothetical protein
MCQLHEKSANTNKIIRGGREEEEEEEEKIKNEKVSEKPPCFLPP